MNTMLQLAACFALIASCTCKSANAQSDQDVEQGEVAKRIAILQNARRTGLPGMLDARSGLYREIGKLGEAKANAQQASNELVEWLPVSERLSYSTEPVSIIRTHPAAIALINLGNDAIPSLKNKLVNAADSASAVLIVRCLQSIYKDDSNAQLKQMKAQASSELVRRAVNFVITHPRETTGVTLEPEM